MVRLALGLLLLAFQLQHATALELSDEDKTNIFLFFNRAIGFPKITEADIKSLPSGDDSKKLLAAGILLNGKLCASVTRVTGLPHNGVYEVTCLAVEGGYAEKTYLVDPATGQADNF